MLERRVSPDVRAVDNHASRPRVGFLTGSGRFRSVRIARPKVLKLGRCLSRGSAGTALKRFLGPQRVRAERAHGSFPPPGRSPTLREVEERTEGAVPTNVARARPATPAAAPLRHLPPSARFAHWGDQRAGLRSALAVQPEHHFPEADRRRLERLGIDAK
jgi:hypothetical protein